MSKMRLSPSLAASWHERVSTHYSESQRHYHTLEHLSELFEYRERFQNKLQKLEVVDLAIWFHDVIYQPTEKDNEEKSAALWDEFAKEVGIGGDVATTVHDYIIATKTHKIDPNESDQDLKFFLDFDLAILGKPESGYDRYASQIRQEYIHVPDETYTVGRAAVLDHLRQGTLFFTEEFKELFEEKAKANISREIASLKSGKSILA
eukprot:TRINITY_DN2538_c0_g1_i8.p1 TRINITY_DN2538_c0_g1~~TRINITY_DN2538_c0_g1_i8.p1  ORF type:complete len:223 (+),score=41.37 TRINITY_DN2538_c0_g1_i8:53-670(+)